MNRSLSMAFLFNKFQEAVKVLAKSPTFARNPRELQFEADMNRLFLFTSYNRLGRDVEEEDAEEIIDMATKASIGDQQLQVQENIHFQIKTFCAYMDGILLPDMTKKSETGEVPAHPNAATRRSGFTYAVGKNSTHAVQPCVPATKPLKHDKVSQKLKELMGYTLDLKPSLIPHKDAGQGLFIDGEADVGTVIAIYPGVIYSPAYYRYIPGYPRVDAQNPYLITRYDGTVINAQPWGFGGENREMWHGSNGSKPTVQNIENKHAIETTDKGADRIWKMLSKPLKGSEVKFAGDILERRNPLALAHFANHPGKGMDPNVMVCPYDFPLSEKDMRTYIPNISFGNEEVTMRRFGSFWFRSGKKSSVSNVPILKSLVLVATRALCNEELLLNYRLSNSKRRPSWYIPVDEEEDRRRWS